MKDHNRKDTGFRRRTEPGMGRRGLPVGIVFGVVLWSSACGPKSQEPKQAGPGSPPPSMEASMPVDSPAVPEVPGKWACKVDGDCMNSCSQGAVNRDWYAMAAVRECEDGCENQLTAPARCIDGGCVAFARDPSDEHKITRSDFCTRRRDR